MSSDIDEISTLWTILGNANNGDSDECRIAQQLILNRYEHAIRRYLMGALRRPDWVEEAYQDFAVKLLRGDYKNADREKGRFRWLLKRSLSNLVNDYWRDFRKQPAPMPEHFEVAARPEPDDDAMFAAVWRDTLIERAWKLLADKEEGTGQPGYTLLRIKVTNPAVRSKDLVQVVEEKFHRAATVEFVRKRLHIARAEFVRFFVDEVVESLDRATLESLEDELASIGMLEQCRDELNIRKRNGRARS